MIDKHLDIFVFGKVHGVFFRANAKRIAEQLGIKGYAKNEGKFVYIEAEGSDEDLDNFIEWCYSGSEQSQVEKIDFKEGRFKNFTSFNIL
jgi:acylphosphatase